MDRHSITTFLVISSLLIFVDTSIQNDLKFRKIDCDPNEKFITNSTCKISVIGREKYMLNMDCDIVKPLSNLSVVAKLYKRLSGYRPFLINMKINVCDVLSRKIFHPLAKYAIQLGKQFTNIVHHCPFSGHVFVRNATYTAGLIESLFPSGIFKLHIEVFEGHPEESIGTVQVLFEVFEEVNAKM